MGFMGSWYCSWATNIFRNSSILASELVSVVLELLVLLLDVDDPGLTLSTELKTTLMNAS